MSARSATEPLVEMTSLVSAWLTSCCWPRACRAAARSLSSLERELDEPGGHRGLELVGCSSGHDPAVVEDGDLVGELVGLLEVLGRQEDRGSVVDQLPDGLPHVGSALGVEPGRRFVEEDDG